MHLIFDEASYGFLFLINFCCYLLYCLRSYDVVRETMHSAISASKTGVMDITLNDFQEVTNYYIFFFDVLVYPSDYLWLKMLLGLL